MKTAFAAVLSTALIVNVGCQGQSAGTSSLAESHIEGNVPSRQNFDPYMKRDLALFLCDGASDCHVEYTLLREGATQTGIAYPKFYVWAICTQRDKVIKQGAARVAAIDK